MARLIKNCMALAVTIAMGTLVPAHTTYAAAAATGVSGSGGSAGYLQLIAQYTYQTAQAVYQIEQFVNQSLVVANSWLVPDTSQTTADLQASFTNLNNTVVTNAAARMALQTTLLQDFFGSSVTTSTVPYANDLTYPTLLGQLYFTPDPRQTQGGPKINSAYNYLKNAAGLTIAHPIPGPNWRGKDADKQKYLNYYSTISAIQTFNGYLLSQLYMDAANNGQFNQQQNALMQQASNSNWFSTIASENAGFVLRQILMFTSQLFVLNTQLVQLQKQMLSAQAMTNTLLIMGNQFTESQLISKATGAS